ncbi:MAG: hypothetical protein NBV77_00300 [Bacteroidia bacterium]|nr:hypothetical protein [Bacteroidia bacterium]
MKKIIPLFLFLFGSTSLAFAQGVSGAEFISDYSNLKGQMVVIKGVTGKVIPSAPKTLGSKAKSVAANKKAPSANGPVSAGSPSSVNVANGSTSTNKNNSSAVANNNTTTPCNIKSGSHKVELDFAKGKNCGCFQIGGEMMQPMNDAIKSGKPFDVTVQVDQAGNHRIMDISFQR